MRPTNPLRVPAVSRLACVLAAAIMAPTATAAAGDDEKYIRVRNVDGGDRVSLQISVRTLEPKAGGPTVRLVGVAHIAQESYYRALQEVLDAHDLVLFEGIGAPWSRAPEGADDDWRAWATKAKSRFVAAEIERQRAEHGALPVDAETFLSRASTSERRQLRDAMTDAWGAPMVYVALGDEFQLASVGADGEPGGGDDISFADQPPIMPEELAVVGEGIQSQLADAAGLVFQLDEINYDQESWVNADVTVTELLGGGVDMPGMGGDDSEMAQLMATLSGDSFMSKIVGVVLRMVGSSEYSRAIFRIALIEMLGRMDELMPLAGTAMGGDEMIELLLDMRNDVVLEMLDERLSDVPPGSSVAIFYGAGHLPGLEDHLLGEGGYVLRDTEWLPAIEVDYNSSGLPRATGEMFRGMIGRSVDRQIEMFKRLSGD